MSVLRRILPVFATKLKPTVPQQRFYTNDLYEPPYLEAMKSKVPLYDTINIQIQGYDYSILESFQKLINRIAKNMDVAVEESWALPQQDFKIVTYKPDSEILNSEYKLKKYHRTVQVTDISSIQLPILIRALEASTPSGVSLEVLAHQDYHEEIRYVPDEELLTLKQELDDMGGPRKTR